MRFIRKRKTKINNKYASIICEYCPCTYFGEILSEYVLRDGTYVSCEGRDCEEAYKYYVEKTGDDTPFDVFF